jgi:hypothetical protein
VILVAVTALRPAAQGPAPNPNFDFDTGNSAIEVIIPWVIPALFQTTAPNDAPIVLRWTTMITNGWFDAIAPYHPTALGVYSRLGRRPASEASTNRNKNVAMFYSAYRVLNSLAPRFAGRWRDMMTSVGLDPDDASENPASPVGIGNRAGRSVVAVRERDGMNQLGDEGGRVYDRRPYEDYTGYRPVNTPYLFWNPSRWQPLMNTPGNGTFAVQQFVTPQWAVTRPYSYNGPAGFNVPPPTSSNVLNFRAYKAQADEVMAMQAALSDEEKMLAELFDNKISSLGFAALFVTLSRGLTLDEFVQYDFLTNLAAFASSTRCGPSTPSGSCIATGASAAGVGRGAARSTTCLATSGARTSPRGTIRSIPPGRRASALHTRRRAAASLAPMPSAGRCRCRPARL